MRSHQLHKMGKGVRQLILKIKEECTAVAIGKMLKVGMDVSALSEHWLPVLALPRILFMSRQQVNGLGAR